MAAASKSNAPTKAAPVVGDRVRLLGSLKVRGTLEMITKENWAVVRWDDETKASRMCHLHALVREAAR